MLDCSSRGDFQPQSDVCMLLHCHWNASGPWKQFSYPTPIYNWSCMLTLSNNQNPRLSVVQVHILFSCMV